MRLDKIYTKVGDKGTTLLASGHRVSKASLRLEAYGTVDELNSFFGLFCDQVIATPFDFRDLISKIHAIQNELFDLGAELATPLESLNTSRQTVISDREISRLEQEIDDMNTVLPPLANFILPGGHATNSLAHVVRTICRRAERRVVELSEHEKVRDEVKIYLNRLSDWCFVLCRFMSHKLGVKEVLWKQRFPEK